MRDRSLIFANVLALVLVLVLAPLVYVPRIEQDLGHRCRAELAEQGIRASIVLVDGRDVILEGSLQSLELTELAEQVVGSVWGVREVFNRLGADLVSPEARAEEVRRAFCEVIITPSRLFILGLIPDEATRRQLLSSLGRLDLGRDIESRLEVINGVGRLAEADSVAVVTGIIASQLDQGTFRIEGDTVTLKGAAPDENTLQSVTRLVGASLPGLRIRDLVTIAPVPEAGSFAQALAELFMDGTVEFEPDAEILTPASLRILDRLVELLERFADARIAIAVPVAPTGDTEYDLELRSFRVEAVTDYLRLRGVASERYRVPHTDEMNVPAEQDGDTGSGNRVYIVEDR